VTSEIVARLRQILLSLVLLSIVGLLVELILLEHYDSAWQWTPLVLLGIALVSTVIVALRPGRHTILFFEGIMILCIAAGLLGLYLHYRGNVEFELERDTSLHGLALFWEAIRGATPALAPAAMAQLGLLGLAFAYRHPLLRPSSRVPNGADPQPTEIR
jgi:hypothetical protein